MRYRDGDDDYTDSPSDGWWIGHDTKMEKVWFKLDLMWDRIGGDDDE